MALSHSKWLRLFIYGGIGLIIFSLYFNYQLAKLLLIPTELEKHVVRESAIEENKLWEMGAEFRLRIKEHKKSGFRVPLPMEDQIEVPAAVMENENYGFLVRRATEKGFFVFIYYIICFLLFFIGFLPFLWATNRSGLWFFGQEVLGFLAVSFLMIIFRYLLN